MKRLGFLALHALLVLTFARGGAAETITLLNFSGTQLTFVDSSNPSQSLGSIAITGLAPGEFFKVIDYRPATGQLYGIAANVSAATLYVINTTTGAATRVGSGPFDPFIGGRNIAMDFNPVTDQIRIITNNAGNYRLNPNDATLVTDTSIDYAPGDPNAAFENPPVGIAYTNNVNGASSTTLYGIAGTDTGVILVTVGSPGGSPSSPDAGLLFTVGPIGSGNLASFAAGMDISGATGVAYAHNESNQLRTVNLATGASTVIGAFPGSGALDISVGGVALLTPTTTTLTSTPNPSTAGSTVTFTATVTPASGAVTPTGTVTFTDGVTTYGSAPVGPTGTAVLSIPLAQGTYTIQAVYTPTGTFLTSTSVPVIQVVNAPAPRVETSIPTLDVRALLALVAAVAAAGFFAMRR